MDSQTRTIMSSVVFTATFIFLLIGLAPFQPGDAPPEGAVAGRQAYFYLFALITSVISFFLISDKEKAIYYSLFNRPLILFLIFVPLACLFAEDKFLALKNYLLFLVCFSLYTFIFILPDNRKHLSHLFIFIVGLVLFLCYFGVIFLPHLSIHQSTDIVEPHLAGDWRGVWPHKNYAGPMMGSFIFISIFLIAMKRGVAGAVLLSFAALFIAFTGAKTATVAVFLTFISVFPSLYISSDFIRVCFLLGPFIFLNLMGAGQIIVPQLKSAFSFLPVDHSFSGRDSVWQFSFDNFTNNILFGRGFNSFWASDFVKNSKLDDKAIGAGANHGHQTFMDITQNLGFIGLFLFIIWAIYIPIKNLNLALKRGHDRATLLLLTFLWQYWLLTSTMETILLERLLPGWFMFCFAVFGLHFMSKYDIDKGDA